MTVLIMTRGSRGFNAAKAIRSSAEETKKLQFISSNCPDGVTTGHPAVSSQPLPRGWVLSRGHFSLPRFDDVPENKWIIGFRRKMPEADGISEEPKILCHLQHLTFHPVCHLSLTSKSILSRQ